MQPQTLPSLESSVIVTSSGCTPASLMEAPNPLAIVDSFLPALCSHPVPVDESGEGVFQLTLTGKYACNSSFSSSVTSVVSSNSFPIRPSSNSSRRTTEANVTTGRAPSSNSNVTQQTNRLSRSNAEYIPTFSVYYQNVRGLRTKIVQLRLMLANCDYDVIVFTETWLREDIDSTEISSDYVLFRCDRSALTSQHARGGGVVIAVKNQFICERISFPNCERLEQIAVCVKAANRSLYIIAVYLPPNTHADLYSAHAHAVQHLTNRASEADIVLSLGDYNLPNLRWQLDDEVNGYIPTNANSEQEEALVESMFATGLRQVSNCVNANERLLDLAFVNLPEHLDLIRPPTPLLPIDNHHLPFVLLFDVSPGNPVALGDYFDDYSYDFNACDFDQVKSVLADIDWNAVWGTVSIDVALATFYDKLYTICNDLVPRKRRSFKPFSSQPWWTSELRHLRNILRKARRRFFATKSVSDRTILYEAESRYKSNLIATHANYIASIQTSIRHNPSRFWDFVRKQKCSTRISRNVSFNEVHANSNTEAANLFALFFESVFSKASPVQRHNCFDQVPSHDINLPLIQFSPNEVDIAINDLDSKKGPGLDGIPPMFLKSCSSELAIPLASLFNRSLRERIFPSAWKIASVVPIHKSGNVNRVTNYRGVSILCCVSKVFEKLVHSALYTVASPLISDSQHGFMKHRSTSTNLMCYVTALSRAMEMRQQTDAIYIDFAKAFDTVPHNLVVEKLRHIGFPVWLLEWILSYLSDRTSFVVVNSARSRPFCNTSGVPQGSVLGPLIFNIYVNDLCTMLSSSKLSFADDLKVFRVILAPNDCIALQEDINTTLTWCADNGMRVNSTKCKVISFTRSNNPICHQYTMDSDTVHRVTSICDLGITIDAKLRFNDHIGIISAKAFSVLGFIRRHGSVFTDVYALKSLYCTLVRSILEYASPIWSPYYAAHVITIERVQEKFVRFVLRMLPWNDPENLPPYPDRCQLIGLESLSARRVKAQRLFVFDVVGGVIDCPALLEQIPFNVPPRRFRNSNLLAVHYHRTNYGFNNPLDACIRLFNEVTNEFDFNMSRSKFKNRISRIV